jgi:hypothetical protein
VGYIKRVATRADVGYIKRVATCADVGYIKRVATCAEWLFFVLYIIEWNI